MMDPTRCDSSSPERVGLKVTPHGPSQLAKSSVNSGSLPTDYISALVRYGSLQLGSDQMKNELHLGKLFRTESMYAEPGLLAQTSFGNNVTQSFESSALELDSRVIAESNNIYEPVRIPKERRCDVCLGILEQGELKCASCGVRVHKSCYWSKEPSKSAHKFMCDVCCSRGLKTPRCDLCNLSGGAMRYAHSDKVWVHCSCVFFASSDSGVPFGQPFRVSDPIGVKEETVGFHLNKSCDACGSCKGLLVPCSYTKCFRYLHPRCSLFHDGYQGTAFSDLIYYLQHERRQYSCFICTLCNEHSTHEYVLSAAQMHLRRQHIIRELRSSSYRKYQNEVSDLVRMISSLTESIFNEDEEDQPISNNKAEPVLYIEPCINGSQDGSTAESDNVGDSGLTDWIEFFKQESSRKDSYAPVELVIDPKDDEILVDAIEVQTPKQEELPVLEVQPSAGDGSLDMSGSQFRSQRMMWQKFDIFRPIPYGPHADDVLANIDLNQRTKSISEYVNLESNVLTCSDFLEPRELGEIYMQQILLGSKGILDLLESLKMVVDRELEAVPRNGTMQTPNERKQHRIHVLLDTGRTAGILIFKVDKGFLEALNGESTLIERGTPISAAEANFVLDDEVRNIISQVQNELVKNTHNTGTFLSNVGGAKEVDIVSGIAEYNLKEDIKHLYSTLNASGTDGDAAKNRRKKLKPQKSEISIKNLELESFIELTPLECELLRRCTLEMSHLNEVNMKMAVMKHTVNVSPSVSCLQVIDWEGILRYTQGTAKDSGRSSNSKGSNSRTSKQTSEGVKSVTEIATDSQPNVGMVNNPAPVPMICLGKQTWPVVDDLNFLRSQKELTESELSTVLSQLRKIRQNIREKVLEMNSRQPKLNEKLGLTNAILEGYEAMDRWSTLVVNFSRGLNDSLEVVPKPPVIPIPVAPTVPSNEAESSNDIKRLAKKAEGLSEGAYCSVCFTNESNNLNPIYTCSRCFMSCHRNCYGVGRPGKDMDQSDYICRRCEYERRSMGSQWQTAFRSSSTICSICGRGGGALKRCDGDEWSHVFCLLALLPETVCGNYISLEPWTLAGVSKWRRESDCEICGINWGLVIRCKFCYVTAHPLCAWLHGYKFSVTSSVGHTSNVTHGGNPLMQNLQVNVQCNEHDESRQWEKYITMRNKRFLNRDTAYALFEGKDKKRRLRSLLPECLASSEMLDTASILADINEIPPLEEEKRCGVCFGTGDLIDFQNCPESVHYWCYVEQENRYSDSASCQNEDSLEFPDTLVCDMCMNNDKGCVCGICNVPNGVLKHVPGTGTNASKSRRYIHVICGICFPDALVALYRGTDFTNKEKESAQCCVCNSAEGLMVQCCNEDCDVHFHAICGMLNRFSVEAHCLDLKVGPQYVAFCQLHSLVCKNVGPNLKLLLRFRMYMRLLRDLVTDLAAQDTVMRAWYRKRQELLNAEYPLTLVIQKGSV